MRFDKLFQRESGSDDLGIVLVDSLVEVSHSLVLSDVALAVLSPVGLQLLVDDLVVDGLVLELDVLSQLYEDSDVVLAAQEVVAVLGVSSELGVDGLVVGELSLVGNQVGADLGP